MLEWWTLCIQSKFASKGRCFGYFLCIFTVRCKFFFEPRMIVVELEGERERESTGLRDLLAQNYEKQDKKKEQC